MFRHSIMNIKVCVKVKCISIFIIILTFTNMHVYVLYMIIKVVRRNELKNHTKMCLPNIPCFCCVLLLGIDLNLTTCTSIIILP